MRRPLPPTPALLLRARGAILRGFLFLLPLLLLLLFGGAPPPVTAFRDARTTEGRLEASPSTGRDRLTGPSELAGARKIAGAGIMEVPESVGGMEDEGAIDVA